MYVYVVHVCVRVVVCIYSVFRVRSEACLSVRYGMDEVCLSFVCVVCVLLKCIHIHIHIHKYIHI